MNHKKRIHIFGWSAGILIFLSAVFLAIAGLLQGPGNPPPVTHSFHVVVYGMRSSFILFVIAFVAWFILYTRELPDTPQE